MSDFKRVNCVHFLKPPQDDQRLPVLTEVVEIGAVHAPQVAVLPPPLDARRIPVLTDVVEDHGWRRERRAA
jgi:hypothetical protein